MAQIIVLTDDNSLFMTFVDKLPVEQALRAVIFNVVAKEKIIERTFIFNLN